MIVSEILNVEEGRRSFSKLVFVVSGVGVSQTFLTGGVDVDPLGKSSAFRGNDIIKLKLIVAIVTLVVRRPELDTVLHLCSIVRN